MKYTLIGVLLVITISIGYLMLFKDGDKSINKNESKSTNIKWDDSLKKHLPSNLDTTITVVDNNGVPLKFYQYIQPVFNNEAMIYQDKGVWRLFRFTKSAIDSLKRDDYAIARIDRAQAFRSPDTILNWKSKLNAIANTLNQADYVMVIKSSRKLYIFRNQKQIQSYNIDLGFSPLGNKVTDGDGKTPEGIYHLDLKQQRDDQFYKSIWVSYPNDQDKILAKKRGVKPGVGIMLHGTTPKNVNSKDWTAGCIALQNKDIDSLFKYVGNGTIIEIIK